MQQPHSTPEYEEEYRKTIQCVYHRRHSIRLGKPCPPCIFTEKDATRSRCQSAASFQEGTPGDWYVVRGFRLWHREPDELVLYFTRYRAACGTPRRNQRRDNGTSLARTVEYGKLPSQSDRGVAACSHYRRLTKIQITVAALYLIITAPLNQAYDYLLE